MDDVYATLNGEMLPGKGVPGVENLFAEGSRCDQWYTEIYEAERRLEARLGAQSHDDDVERIIGRLLEIQIEMCYRMYYYGAKFGMRE